jgi:hypothetical protein
VGHIRAVRHESPGIRDLTEGTDEREALARREVRDPAGLEEERRGVLDEHCVGALPVMVASAAGRSSALAASTSVSAIPSRWAAG